MIKGVEHKHFAKRVVKASIPVHGPGSVEGLKAGYSLTFGEPCVWFNDGSTEIPG